jgi:hypothetical protein
MSRRFFGIVHLRQLHTAVPEGVLTSGYDAAGHEITATTGVASRPTNQSGGSVNLLT